MRRDFTDAAKSELLSLVDQVESEKWCDLTDWFGDRFLDLRSLVGELSLDNYLNNMTEYHKLVIDKNNTTREQIEAIFSAVYDVDNQFVSRFGACQARLHALCRLIDEMAQVIAPTGGSLSIDASRLDRAFEEFNQLEEVLAPLAPDGSGITYEQLDSMSDEARQKLTQSLVQSIVGTLPNGSLGGEIEIPIGPGLSFYYKGKADIDNDSDFDLDAAFKDGQIELKNFSYTVSSGDAVKIEGTVSNDGLSASVSNDYGNVNIDEDGASYSSSWRYGDNTYTYTDGFRIKDAEAYTEMSVRTDYPSGSVTSTAGFTASSNTGWKPVTVPIADPVPSYSPISIPSVEIPTWVPVVAAVVVVAAGILLIPETGGASLALCAI